MSTPGDGKPRGLEQLDAAVVRLTREVVSIGNQSREAVTAAAAAADEAARSSAAVEQLAGAMTRAADTGADGSASGQESAAEDGDWPVSWWEVQDAETARRMLAALGEWLQAVYVRYRRDDAMPLRECWAWHPAAVAELWTLRECWYAVHRPGVPPQARMDWHDRWRPGVAKRLHELLNGCALRRHVAGSTSGPVEGTDRARVSGEQSYSDLAAWWAATHGARSAPAPSADLLAAVQGGQAARRV